MCARRDHGGARGGGGSSGRVWCMAPQCWLAQQRARPSCVYKDSEMRAMCTRHTALLIETLQAQTPVETDQAVKAIMGCTDMPRCVCHLLQRVCMAMSVCSGGGAATLSASAITQVCCGAALQFRPVCVPAQRCSDTPRHTCLLGCSAWIQPAHRRGYSRGQRLSARPCHHHIDRPEFRAACDWQSDNAMQRRSCLLADREAENGSQRVLMAVTNFLLIA